MPNIILESDIISDSYTENACKFFDVPFAEKNKVIINNNLTLPDEWSIGLIFGPSGCGKSTILKTLGDIKNPQWDNSKSVISNFSPLEFEDASKALCSVGLSSIPTWFRPYNVLSNGEKFRADLARLLIDDSELHLVDEFTSVVDRNVAKSTAGSVSKWIIKEKKKVIFSSCHEDIIEWLQPDWVYNPLEGKTTHTKGLLWRPHINLQIFRVKYEAWEYFKQHHYLSESLNKSSKCFMVTWNNKPVAFNATLALPHPVLKNSWRESRTVVIPDYQGIGIGTWLSDYVAGMVKARGGRYFSKTTHPAMVSYRVNSKKWKETTHSRKARTIDYNGMIKKNWTASRRECYAFEYIGSETTLDESELFWNKC